MLRKSVHDILIRETSFQKLPRNKPSHCWKPWLCGAPALSKPVSAYVTISPRIYRRLTNKYVSANASSAANTMIDERDSGR